MAERIETVSFDVDVAGATRQIDAYINTLNKLDKELADLQKAGKDTAATQQKIAATTAALNKALQGETKTLAGAVAQTAAYDKAQKSLNATTQKTIVATTNLDTVTKKQTASFGRSLAGAKNLTQAFTRGLGGLSNLVGGFGLASIGVNLLSDGVAKLVDEFFKASQAQTSLANVNKAYAETVATETAALQVNFAALNNTTLSLTQRKEALGALIEQFPEYFGGLEAETATVEQLKVAYEGAAVAIKQKAIQSALAAERQALISSKIKLEIEQVKELQALDEKRAKVQGDPVGEAIVQSVVDGVADKYRKGLEDIAQAEQALIDVEAKLGGQITINDKIKAATARRAARERIEADKADAEAAKKADAAAEKAKQRREAAVADRQKEREAIAAENAENERLKGTLAGLQKELAKINELLNSGVKITDKERLEELGAEYQRITKDIEKATEAIDAVTKARKADEVQVIQNAKIGNIETELLRGRIAANQKALEQQELQRQRQLNQIETNRQAALSATQNDTARTIIEASNAKKREDFERESAETILQLRIKLQKQKLDLAQREGQDTNEIANEILKLEAELLALTGKRYDIKIGVDEKSAKSTKEKLKELVNQVADVVEEFSGQVFDFLNTQNAQTAANADAAISKQQEVLNALLANEETTNVEQVRLEQERLEKLNEAREKAKEQEARIAQAQIAINLALAVARAVAEGGGVASAITVGLALSAAIFGFIQAKQTAEQSFYEGTMYAERAPHEPRGRDTIKANINEGEAIIPTDTTRKYNAALEAIYYGKIPASDMNAMVGDYLNGVRSGRDEINAAAESSKREFRILHYAREERRPAAASESSNTADLRAVVELVVTELRKQPQQVIKGDKIVSLVQSKADAKGRMRKRYGTK
jgi:hypothetical protein